MGELTLEEKELLKKGEARIVIIKRVRQRTGLGLKEAKDLVNEYAKPFDPMLGWGGKPERRVDFWLGKVTKYGYVGSLEDGPHDDEEGARRAFKTISRLRLGGGPYAVVRVEVIEEMGQAEGTGKQSEVVQALLEGAEDE